MKKNIKPAKTKKERKNFRVSKAAIGTILFDCIDAGRDGAVSAEAFMATMLSLHDYIENADNMAGEDIDAGLWMSFKARIDKSAERSAAARLRWDRIRAERATAAALAAPLEIVPVTTVTAPQETPTVCAPIVTVTAPQAAPVVTAPQVIPTVAAPIVTVTAPADTPSVVTPIVSETPAHAVSAPVVASAVVVTPASEAKPVEAPVIAPTEAAQTTVTEVVPESELPEEMKELKRNSPLRPYKVTEEMRRYGIISVEEKGYIRFEKEGYTGKELKKKVEEYVHEILVRRRRRQGLPDRGW